MNSVKGLIWSWLVVLLVAAGGLYAEPAWTSEDGELLWAVSGPGGWDVGVDSAGNAYVTGNQWVTSDGLAKYDPDGALLWHKPAEPNGNAIAVEPSGNALVIGGFSDTAIFGPGETNETVLNGGGFFLAKYAPYGKLLWARVIAGRSYGYGADLAVNASGDVVVTGGFSGTMTFGPGDTNETVLTPIGWEDIFVAKYSPDGLLLWAKSAGGGLDDWGHAIAIDDEGNCAVTGAFGLYGAIFGAGEPNETVLLADVQGTIPDPVPFANNFVAKFASDGMLLWAKTIGGEVSWSLHQWEDGTGIAIDRDANTVVTGRYFSPAIFGEGEPNETMFTEEFSGVFLAKYGEDGMLRWARALPDSPGDVDVDSAANSIVTFGGPSEFVPDGVAKFDADGELVWEKLGEPYAQAIAVDDAGNILTTNSFEGTVTFGAGGANETVLTGGGTFVAKYAGAQGDPPWGLVWADHEWTDLCRTDLVDTVILLGPPTHNGGDAGVARMQATDDAGCPYQVRFAEWDYRARDFNDLWHKPEQISYLGLTPGVQTMDDGSVWEVGSFEHWGNGVWKPVSFQSSFAGTPTLFLTIQTANGTETTTARARNVDPDGFDAAMFEEEYLMGGGHATETIGYMAIYHPDADTSASVEGVATIDGAEVPYTLNRTWLNHNWAAIDGTELHLEEEQSLDDEVAHKDEMVDVLTIGGQVFAQQVSSYGGDTAAIRRR